MNELKHGSISKEYVDLELEKKPNINNREPDDNTTWSSKHSAEIIENLVVMANTEIEKVKLVDITIYVNLPTPDFDAGNDRIQFVDNNADGAVFSVKVKDVINPSKFNFTATLPPDVFGRFELVRNGIVISRTPDILTNVGRNEYTFICTYNDNTFVWDEQVPQGTLEVVEQSKQALLKIHIDKGVGGLVTVNHKIVFVDEKTRTTYADKVVDTNGERTGEMELTVPNDIYGYLALYRNEVEAFRTQPFISQNARNDYKFNCDYSSITFTLAKEIPQGTVDAIKANVGTLPPHNELEGIQGGKKEPNSKGEFFHLNRDAYSKLSQLMVKKALEVNRLFTKDEKNNIANLVSHSDFSILYGNRLVSNTQMSNFKNEFKHMYNDGKIDTYRPIRPSESIPPKSYTQSIFIKGKSESELNYLDGLKITKIAIECDDSDEATPQMGKIELYNNNGEALWKSSPNGTPEYLIDSYGNFKGRILFDISTPISVFYGEEILCLFDIVSNGVRGELAVGQPSVSLVVEQLQEKIIAHVDDIRIMNPNATSNEEIFNIFVYDEQGKEACIMDIRATQEQIFYGKITVPLQDSQGNIIKGINCKINPKVDFKEFVSESATWVEFDEPNEDFFFDGLESLERIYLPNVDTIAHNFFIRDCPNLKELYVPKLETFGTLETLIQNCPNLVVYTKNDNLAVIDLCKTNNIKYRFIDLPSPIKNKAGDVLSVAEDGTCVWKPVQGGGGSNVTDSTINGNILVDGSELVVYEHPTTHSPSIIAQDESNRFVSDVEKADWNSKYSSSMGSLSYINDRLTLGYRASAKGLVKNGFPIEDRDFAFYGGDRDQLLIDKTNGDIYTRIFIEPKWTGWNKSQSVSDSELSTYSKEIVKAINELQNIVKGGIGLNVQYKPFDDANRVPKANIQSYYDTNKSEYGFLSPDTLNPLSLYPDLPVVERDKYAIWLGDTTWYYSTGNGTNSCWSNMTAVPNKKQDFGASVLIVAMGTGQGYATKNYTDKAIAENAMPTLTFIDGNKADIDFKTCFKHSGMFRVFNAKTNMPPSYASKDSDFYCSVYYTEAGKWIKIMASDVRSSRMFTTSLVNGTWNPWMEVGVLDDTTALVTKTWSAKKTADELKLKQDVQLTVKNNINITDSRSESCFITIGVTGTLPTEITLTADPRYIFQANCSTKGMHQILMDSYTGKMWVRGTQRGASWSSWVSVVMSWELAKKQDIVIPSNPAATDINTVFNSKTESYQVGFSNLQSTGLPTGITSGSNIVTLEGIIFGGKHKQILNDMNSAKSWIRFFSSGGWTAWVDITSVASGSTPNLPDGTYLDTIVDNNLNYAYGIKNAKGAPKELGATNEVLIEGKIVNGKLRQTIYDMNGNGIWTRACASSSSPFTDWSSLL